MTARSAPALDPILATKLHIPPLRANRVPRPRLAERLEAGVRGPLTLLSAPAGFGKSTLLSEWIHASGRHVAWLSLDEGDNDPRRFLRYAITALQTVRPEIGRAALAALRQAEAPATEDVLTGLVNEIAALEEDLVLVLDDYHVIEAEGVHRDLQFYLDRLPPQMHLVIATRVDPPLRLSRLRARGQLTELRAQDLRFNSPEAAGFLNQAMGLKLSAEDVEALGERTEGWAVGLQMAALSLQGRTDARDFIEHFTGSHRFVLDYLTDEVLSRQSAEVREFLLRTSVLSRLSGPLCDAVTERADSQALLEELDATNLFLIQLDDVRHWYRYHHLFGTLLRHQLERKAGSEGVAALNRRASDWYAARGYPDDALEHALAAGAPDRATELVVEHALPRLMGGDAGTVVRWVRSLPPEWLASQPRLRLTYAWALVSNLHFQEAEEQVREAERSLGGETCSDPELAGQTIALRGLLTRSQGKPREAIELYRCALEHLPAEETFSRGIITMDLGTSHLTLHELADAERELTAARELNRKSGNVLVALLANWHLGELRFDQGRLHEALEIHRQGLQLAEEIVGRGEESPACGLCYAGMATVRREWDDLSGAAELAVKAIDLGRRGGLGMNLSAGGAVLSRVRLSQGDCTGALEALDITEEVTRRAGNRQWINVVVAHRAHVLLCLHRLEESAEALAEALRWARTSGLLDNLEGDLTPHLLIGHGRNRAHLNLARLFLARGERQAALGLLARLLPLAQEAGTMNSEVEILALTALARNASGDRAGALEPLRRALTLAEPQGFVRIFVDEGRAMAELIERAAPGAVPAAYAATLRNAFGPAGDPQEAVASSAQPPPPPEPRGAPLPAPAEALSEREIEVLRLIATGLSNAETGRKLFIAPSTVKKHLENIYGKLATGSRTQAIARAREMGLL